jgi:hypothetical protein
MIIQTTTPKQLSPAFSLLAGPSLNYYISEVSAGESLGTLNTMANLSTKETNNKLKSLWIGFNIGVGLKL